MVAGRLLTARVMWLAVAASAISRAAGTRVLANHSDENVSLESMWSSAAVGPVNCVPGGSSCAPGGSNAHHVASLHASVRVSRPTAPV